MGTRPFGWRLDIRQDVVVSDLDMPGMNGIELARRLHVFARRVPVILTTGLQETRDVVTAASSYGAVACLKKPMSLDEVLWTIDRAIACETGRAPVVRHRDWYSGGKVGGVVTAALAVGVAQRVSA